MKPGNCLRRSSPTISMWVLCLAAIGLLSAGSSACQASRKPTAQRYELKGKVVAVDRQKAQVTIAHEAIPGYMEAMTMPFRLKDDWPFSILEPGNQIQATLVVEGDRSWLEEVTITQSSPAETPSPNTSWVTQPEPGAEVPNFSLSNQDGRRIRLHQYRGQALVVTFIYTRCPLPDYCPLMSQHFAQINRALEENPAHYPRTHLLSVSFDSDFDTPEVLRRYAATYLGKRGRTAFEGWEFASGTEQEIKQITSFFGLSYWPQDDQIVHSLSTTLISPEGKVVKVYRGNEWKPEELLAELAKLQ